MTEIFTNRNVENGTFSIGDRNFQSSEKVEFSKGKGAIYFYDKDGREISCFSVSDFLKAFENGDDEVSFVQEI